MSVSIWQDKFKKTNTKEPLEFDITIIGAGIAGLSTAFWLLEEDPSLKVAILEKGQVANGASGRNAGFITCGSVEHFNRLLTKHGEKEALEIWKFSETNLDLLKQKIINTPEIESKIGFEQKGSFSLASTEAEFEELKKSQKLMESLRINVEVLQKIDIQKRLGAKEFVGGIKYINDASVHPVKLIEEILTHLKTNNNFKLFQNHEVFQIQNCVAHSGNKLVKTSGAYFSSPITILATNGYSPQLNPFFEDKIFPTRGQILATESVPSFMEGPCYANFVLDYFRQTTSGEMVIGGFRQLQKDVEIGYSDETSPVIQKALEDFLQKHIPAVKEAKITHRWSGIMGFSVDGQPMIGSLPTDNQIFFLGGFTAHGLGLAFHTAKCLVDIIFGRPVPDFINGGRFKK